MKGRRKIEGIIAFVLSLALIMPNFNGILQVSATTGNEVITSESPAPEETLLPETSTTEPTAEPTVEPTAAPEISHTITGEVKFGESYMAEGEELILNLINSKSEKTSYYIIVGENGTYRIKPNTIGMPDGVYTLSVEKAGFNVTTSVTQVEIKDNWIVTDNAEKILNMNINTELAEIVLVSDSSNGDTWEVNKKMSYVINNYNPKLNYSYSSEHNYFEFYMNNGYVDIIPVLISDSKHIISLSVSYGGVTKTTSIDINNVDICKTAVSVKLEPTNDAFVTEQALKINIANISAKIKGEVVLSCVEGDIASNQGQFYVLKDGKKVLCEDGKVQLSECADSTGTFVCYYVGTDKYANYGFEGELTFKVAYSGVADEYTASEGEVKGTYNTAHPIYFKLNENDESVIGTTNNVDVVYGSIDYVVPLDETKSSIEGYTCTYTYELVDGNNNVITDFTDLPYTVSEDGKITVNRVNREDEIVRVKVTRKSVKNEGFEGQEIADVSAYLELNIVPSELTLNIEESSYIADKVYDNTEYVTVINSETNPLSVSLSGISGNDDVKVESITGKTVNIKAVGEYTDVELSVTEVKLSGANGNDYKVKIDDNLILKGTLNISKRKIGLTVSNSTKEYSKPIDENASLVIVDENSFLTGETADGVNKDSINVPKATINWGEGKESVKEEAHVDVIVPEIDENGTVYSTSGEELKNYEYVVVEKGDLTVVSESIENVWENHLSVNPTINYTDENGNIWFKVIDNGTSIQNVVKYNFNTDAYDVVVLVSEDGSETVVADRNNDEIIFDAGKISEIGKYTYKIVLATKQETAEGEIKYVNRSEATDVSFILDNEEPVAEITEGEDSIINPDFPELKFTIFSNIIKTVNISVSEEPIESAYASGLAEWSYTVKTFEKMPATQEEMQSYVDNDIDKWEKTTEKSVLNVPVGGENELTNNNYVVFVKVNDKAGNSKIYASNGMVLENKAPEITVELCDNEDGIENQYNNAITAKVKIIDSSVSSGIKNVYLHVAENEEAKFIKEDKNSFIKAGNILDSVSEDIINHGNVIALKKGSNEHHAVIGEDSIFEAEITIDDTSDWKVTNGCIQVVAEDYAGNYSIIAERAIVIDKDKPEVEIADYTGSVVSVNGKDYANSDLTLTFNISEVNYDIDRVKLTVNNTTANIKEFTKDGVNVDYTDEKSINVKFSADAEYDVTLECIDKAGNVNEASTSFVLDKTAPDVSVSATENQVSSNEKVNYYSASTTLEFSMTETNFENSAKAPVIILNNGKEKEVIETANSDWTRAATGVYKLIKKIEGDYRYEVSVEYADSATNHLVNSDESLNKTYVVDTSKAEVSIKANVAERIWNKFNEVISFGIISNDDVTVTLNATDSASEIVSIKYFCEDPVIKENSDVVLNKYTAEELESKYTADLNTVESERVFIEQMIDSDIPALDVSKSLHIDARVSIYYRVENAAGHVEYYNTTDGINLVVVDKTAPEITSTNMDQLHIKNETEEKYSLYSEESVVFEFTVEDQEQYSGIKSISYEVLADGDLLESDSDEYEELTYEVNYKTKDIKLKKGYTYNEVKVKVVVEDYAGWETSEEYVIAKDIIEPKASISFEQSNDSNSEYVEYYSEERTAQITFTEMHFAKSSVVINVNYTDSETGDECTYSYNPEKDKLVNNKDEQDTIDVSWEETLGNKDYLNIDRKNIATIIFDKDGVRPGTYHITEISCMDENGNKNNSIQINHKTDLIFVIDQVNPIVTYEHSENVDSDSIYYANEITDSFTIREYNYDPQNVKIQLAYTLEDNNDVYSNSLEDDPEKITYKLSEILESDQYGFYVKLIDNQSKNDKHLYEYEITYKGDSHYRLDDVICMDFAGNVDLTTENIGEFYIDTTAPEFGKISISGSSQDVEINGSGEASASDVYKPYNLLMDWEEKVKSKEQINKWYASQETLFITLTGQDKLSGIDNIYFHKVAAKELQGAGLYNSEEIQSELIKWNSFAELTNVIEDEKTNLNKKQATFAIETEPGEETLIYLKVTNKAGLSSYYVTDGIIVEAVKPIVTITNADKLNGKYFGIKDKINLNVVVDDTSEVWSGIQKVWYRVSAVENGKNVSSANTITEYSYEGRPARGIIEVTGNIPVTDYSKYNSNNVTVTVYGMDVAGNIAESKSVNFAIDNVVPTISAEYDKNSASHDKYFKEDRTLSIKFNERNFDKLKSDVIINYTADNASVPTKYSFNASRTALVDTNGNILASVKWNDSQAGVVDSKLLTDERVNTATITLLADGDYDIVKITCEDLAGNVTEEVNFAENTVAAKEFTIDHNKPILSVTYDNNHVNNSKYYDAVRTATVKITEHNFKADEVKETIKAMLDGTNITSPVMSGFTSNGDVHTATIKYIADGDYSFDIEYTDLAGNVADDFAVNNFTIDTVAPELEFFDIVDKSANNGTVTPGIRYSDINYSKDDVSIHIVGANNGEVSIERIRSSINNGESIKLTDFAHTEDMDDLYTITATIADMAGNETEKKIQFSVNRFGSVYVFGSEECKSWVESVYHNEEAEIYIREINVDTIEESVISVSRDGELRELVAGEDYTATKNNTSTGWAEVHYKLSADNFAEEGNYKITFTSKDRAGNSMDNENARKEGAQCLVEFVIDKTAPTIVIGGVTDNGQYRESTRSMTVDAQDAIALKEVVITIDGKEIIYTVEVDTETGNMKPLKDAMNHQNEIKEIIESAGEWQEITVMATDMAGNVYYYGEQNPGDGGAPIRVLVSPNVFIQYYNNTPLFIGSIVGIIVIAAVIFVIMYKKKKNKEV